MFTDWINGKTPTIWGIGTAGAGKTFLSSIIVHRLKSKLEKPNEIAVLFAYCRSDSQPSISQILGSLLRQLAEDHDSALKYISQQFSVLRNQSRVAPTQKEYVEMLNKVISEFARTFIIIDGLDELEDHIRNLLLHDLGPMGVSLLLMSRAMEDPSFFNLPNVVTFETKPKREELRSFILGEINVHSGLRAALHNRVDVTNQVVEAVWTASRGIYLSASLQMDALKMEGVITISLIRDVITKLPQNLDDMYRLTFERIDRLGPENAAIARRALFWTLHALRPLKIGEMCLAASISPGAGISSPDDIIDQQTLLSSCRGLIVYDKDSGVHLAHETIQSYLNSQHSLIFQGFDESYAAQCCVTVLAGLGLDHQGILGDEANTLIESWHLEYVVRYWVRHTALCFNQKKVSRQIIDFIQSSTSCWVVIDNEFDIWQPIHVSTYLGLESSCLGLEEHCNANSFRGVTPLHLAIKQRNANILSLLLSFESIDVNAPSKG